MIKLYDHPLSPYAQKVRIALREKGLPFEAVTPGGFGAGGVAGEFMAASPRAEVPALIDGAVTVFDSSLILEYLEDSRPEPPLLPVGAGERVRVRMIEEIMDTHYEAINWALGEIGWFKRAEGELAETLVAAAARQTHGFHTWLEGQLGERDWFNGAAFGWGDLAVAPYVAASAALGNARPRHAARLGARDCRRGAGLRPRGRRRRRSRPAGPVQTRISRSPPRMDDQVRRRRDRARGPRGWQHPFRARFPLTAGANRIYRRRQNARLLASTYVE
jgi:glutathione S-transferase/RNA polymerase-associated protein